MKHEATCHSRKIQPFQHDYFNVKPIQSNHNMNRYYVVIGSWEVAPIRTGLAMH